MHIRRSTLRLAALLALFTMVLAACGGGEGDGDAAGGDGSTEQAQQGEEVDEVRIALVVPLSGLFARQGDLVRKGAQFAIDEINEQGGIEALGGAQLVLEAHDAGESVETAVSAADRALSDDLPSAGIGSWLSSFTLGVTEVSERRGVPWLTLSFADPITERGFQYVYQTSATSSAMAEGGLQNLSDLAELAGEPIEEIALVGDNTAAIESFYEAVRGGLAEDMGWNIVEEQIWTPPLTDATPVAQAVRAADPDAILYGATSFADAVQILQANEQFGIEIPYFAVGAWLLTPEYVEGVGEDSVEGIMATVGTHPLVGQEELVERFSEHSGEPFMIQDSLSNYIHVWILKEALELAGSADPEDVNQALKELDLTEGPAAESHPAQRIKFLENGRIEDNRPVIVQWQDGLPVSVFPEEIGQTEPTGL